jgi:hypothetical protein
MSSSPEAINIYSNKKETIGLCLVSLVLISVGIVMLVVEVKWLPPWLALVTALFTLLLGLLGAWLNLPRLLIKGPAMIIDAEGITDQSSPVAVGLIRWNEIRELGISKLSDDLFLSVKLKDVDALFQRLPAWKAGLLRMNSNFAPAPINIPQQYLSMTAEELLDLIHKRFGHLLT